MQPEGSPVANRAGPTTWDFRLPELGEVTGVEAAQPVMLCYSSGNGLRHEESICSRPVNKRKESAQTTPQERPMMREHSLWDGCLPHGQNLFCPPVYSRLLSSEGFP